MKITKADLRKIIKEEIEQKIQRENQTVWHNTVYGLLKNLEKLSPDQKQRDTIEDMVLNAFNEIEKNPEITAVMLGKALKGITREKMNRELAANLVRGAIKRIKPEALNMFNDVLQGKTPKAAPKPKQEPSDWDREMADELEAYIKDYDVYGNYPFADWGEEEEDENTKTGIRGKVSSDSPTRPQ